MGFWKKSQIVANYKWAVRGGLRRETESFMAVQKTGILPELIITKIDGSKVVSPEYRICGQAPGTISLTVIGFTELAGSEYKLVHVKTSYSMSLLLSRKCRI